MIDVTPLTRMTEVDYDPFASTELARAVPTTEAQREIWLADQLGSEASLAYNESVSLHIAGALDDSALQNALLALSNRHEALRSTLSADGLNMLIASRGSLQTTVLDLGGKGEAEQAAVLARLRAEAVETPFDLTNGPLVRATLVKLGVASHQLLITSHHVVCDGWSLGVLATELMSLYGYIVGGKGAMLPYAESFGDYALAQLDAGHVQAAEADTSYWVSMYDSSVPVLELPIDHGRPVQRSFASRREDLRLPASLVDGLRKCGAKQGASLFATMFAMFAGLLSRLSGQDDVVVGVPAAGQLSEGKNSLVGHCVNLLPIRVAAEMEVDIESLIKGAHTCVLDAYDHQHCTFGSVLKRLQLARHPSRLPLVSVLFNIDAAIRSETLSVAGLKVQLYSNPRHFENFELFLNTSQVDGEVVLELQYNTDLFKRATVQRWLTLYRTALERAVTNPKQLVAEAFAPTDDDLALLARFNHTEAPYPRASRVETLIARQAAATPEAIAVTAGAVQLSYRELDQRANALAAALRQRGVAADDLVGLSCGRNQHMLVGMLGILKSGAGYIPLDPSFPADRLGFMAEDAGLRFVVSDRSVTEAWKFGSTERIDLDDLGMQAETPAPLGSVEDVAYVIYTSGSTGKPKGVQVPHRAVTNLLESVCLEPGMDAHHNVLAVTTLSFDIAVSEVILPLTVGARVVVADRSQATDGERLRALIETQRINFINATPSTWRLLLAAGWQGSRELRAICTGEPLPPDLGRDLLGLVGELWNGYGPTETTVWSSFYRVTEVCGTVPIGRPIANTQIHVVDARLRTLPVGAIGELFIGGDGVTLGYLGRSELTTERFLPDPYGAPGARWYKTGDFGRWRADGVLECLGRSDHQVKMRGYRIELGEIEANLTSHASVDCCVVTTREDRPGDVRLVAYVVARTASKISDDTLKAHLKKTLPEYMIPQHVVALPAIPLLPNGKVDRKALPAPDTAVKPSREYVAPRTDLEKLVVATMESILSLPGVGIYDSFFMLGGHSLLAAQLASRLGRTLSIHVPMRALFEAPSPEQLAKWIEAQLKVGDAAAWPIPRRPDRDKAPLSLMQQRVWFMEKLDPGRAVYNTPSAHRLRGKLDEAAFAAAFAEMVRRQDALRTVIAIVDETPMQIILPEVAFKLLPATDLRSLPSHDREQVLLDRLHALAGTLFDLGQAPLFRAELFRLEEEEYAFFFMTHHIIWDAWSFDIFYQEMAALYEAFHHQRPSPFSDLPITYGDFAAWQREWMQGEELATQVGYWKARLAGQIEPLAIPTDHTRPAAMSGNGYTVWMSLSTSTLDRGRALGLRANATLFMSMLATYVLMLHRLTGQREIMVGIPVRGRDMAELEPVMGFFVNTLPLRIRIAEDATFLQLLEEVRDGVLDAFKYPDVPFEHLVRELNVPRDRSRFPLYQAMFSYQDGRQRILLWDNICHERIRIMQPGMAEDIGLWFIERPEGLIGGFKFSQDILTEETAQLLSDRFVHLVNVVFADPDTPISQLPLPEAELHKLTVWNARQAAFDCDAVVHSLFESQVQRDPGRTALTFGHESISYGELDARANRLAHTLRARGVRRGHLVGLCVARGVDMVVALIAVLKSGAAYVPLDPSYPEERLVFMAEDAKLSVLVTESALSVLPDWPREKTLDIDSDAAQIAAQSSAPLVVDDGSAGPQDVAYVIYTSGSTGKPKGVQVPHRAVVNFLTSMQRDPGLTAEDRLLAVTTLSFDIAVLELLLPLVSGAQLVLASRDEALDGHALAGLIATYNVSVMQATPVTWRMLLDTGWCGGSGFKALIGGEALPSDLAQQLLERTGQLWNMYGPTETTVWSTCWRVEHPECGIVIGRPIANTQVWILDEQRQLCPIGVPGEIWIGGDGVTLGYLNRPELTAERFIVDPFSTGPGARLYRTGDRGRWRADGQLEHLGRLDFQVKVRGYRIELGEIEACVASYPGIAQVVAITHEDEPGDVRLAAYFVHREGVVAPNVLRDHVSKSLPLHMVPQYFVQMGEIPLLPNGKIDRKALPKPQPSVEVVTLSTQGLPESDTEKLLAGVWCELLKIPDVSTQDNFFDLGGHSLLAMQAILVMEGKTGKRLNPKHFIFETLGQIARRYDEAEPETASGKQPGRLRRVLLQLLGT